MNIKPNKKNEMEYEGNEDKLYPSRNTPCYNQILSKARNNFLIISSAYVKSIRIFFPNFPMALHWVKYRRNLLRYTVPKVDGSLLDKTIWGLKFPSKLIVNKT